MGGLAAAKEEDGGLMEGREGGLGLGGLGVVEAEGEEGLGGFGGDIKWGEAEEGEGIFCSFETGGGGRGGRFGRGDMGGKGVVVWRGG